MSKDQREKRQCSTPVDVRTTYVYTNISNENTFVFLYAHNPEKANEKYFIILTHRQEPIAYDEKAFFSIPCNSC